MVNKFLYPNGGSETYIFKLGKQLEKMGHQVEFFGMEDERNIVGNSAGAMTPNKEFRSKISVDKLKYPFEIIYSNEAKKQIRRVLDSFKPDVVHFNNINFQITPSVIAEIKKDNIPIVWTVHDYQLVCPNHMFYVMQDNRICTDCMCGKYINCIKNKCLHGSTAKSALAAMEGYFYKFVKLYGKVDAVICPSAFIKDKLEQRSELKDKCVVMYNFIDDVEKKTVEKGDYVLYFGRFDREKGIKTLIEVCKELKDIKFVFAGSGELEYELNGIENVENVGFKTGAELEMLIRRAVMSVYPSEWYENCPFSVIESQMYGVPVIGANIGGIPELVSDGKTGLLFESGDKRDLAEKISRLWFDRQTAAEMSENCLNAKFDNTEEYCKKLIDCYRKIIH